MSKVLPKPEPALVYSEARGGSWLARKLIPHDVREEYARLYGKSAEERLRVRHANPLSARAAHREWCSEIEHRIADIRRSRQGIGRLLSPAQARALAGQWYEWWTSRAASRRPGFDWGEYWHHLLDDDLQFAAVQCGVHNGRPSELLENPAIRSRMHPVVSDQGEVATFLASRGLRLAEESHATFLDYLVRDFFAAVELLERRSRGDFAADERVKQFPTFETPGDSGVDPVALFELWVAATSPAPMTVNRWRSVFEGLKAANPGEPATALSDVQIRKWANGLVGKERNAATVNKTWITAGRTVFRWGVEQQHVSRNPFAGVRVSGAKRNRSRETKAFHDDEIKLILSAALQTNVTNVHSAARRWCPWLCAYSGARISEITQLRKSDVIERDGVPALRITPEAGTVKTGETRVVPIHAHVIEMGFLDYVKSRRDGPLFYAERVNAKHDPLRPQKPKYMVESSKIAQWIRKIGVNDLQVRPNHGWRHSFKQIGRRVGISDSMLDSLCGHAAPTEGRAYGEPTLKDKAAALTVFPRYTLVLGVVAMASLFLFDAKCGVVPTMNELLS